MITLAAFGPFDPLHLGLLVLAYLLGSLPFGLLIGRLMGFGDIRQTGSGNIGATNALRVGGRKLAALTLLGDMGKGTLAVLLGKWLGDASASPALYAACAFIGHVFPVWLKFRGGKGVATFIGGLIVVSWQALLVFALLWLGTAFLSRYSSLAALLAALATPPALLWLAGQPISALVYSVMVIVIILKHHANIKRLLAGNESKIKG